MGDSYIAVNSAEFNTPISGKSLADIESLEPGFSLLNKNATNGIWIATTKTQMVIL